MRGARRRTGRGREEIVDGFENTLDTFLKLFDGSNQGKLIFRLEATSAAS